MAVTAELVSEVRRLVGDPAGASQVWEDDDIETVLSNWQTDVRYLPLTAVETIAPGGAVTYLDFYAGVGWWGDGETLLDTSYNALTAASADRRRGHWTFAEHTAAPVYIVGERYDVYGAAAEVVENWIAKVKLEYTFAADGASFSRNQQIDGLKALLTTLQSKSEIGTVRMVRSDAA